jgi:hypothetical protein
MYVIQNQKQTENSAEQNELSKLADSAEQNELSKFSLCADSSREDLTSQGLEENNIYRV